MNPVEVNRNGLVLGVNGFGRIGKLTVWHHLARRYFKEIVVNLGREAGTGLADVAHYLEHDSTYGRLQAYLHGCGANPAIGELDEKAGTMLVDGIRLRFLRQARNPRHIGWGEWEVRVVVDSTGRFLDPTVSPDDAKGSLRGHLDAGAEKVILSAPFKIKDQGLPMPEDAITTVMGINSNSYDPRRHRILSNASCTTTCLAHMVKPLIQHFGPKKLLSASMATVHAATSSQQVLDRLPEAGKKDLRKNRSVMNNIILTTTGAAKALALVIPEMSAIGFIAESVRVPVATGSLIILVVNLQDEPGGGVIRRDMINAIYKQAEQDDPQRYLQFSDRQNVSGDFAGNPRVAATIEGAETHTRTAEVTIDLRNLPGLKAEVIAQLPDPVVRIPVTQAVIYGWYDNEMGSYVNMLGDRTVTVAESL